MAPSTRSKAVKLPNESKKRAAQDSSDEDSDSKDVRKKELQSGNRSTVKRRKMISGDADTKKTPSRRPAARKPGTTTTRGGLKALPNMPLDVLEEIFYALDPESLVNISRTTKAFRQLLLSPGYVHVWREVFLRDESGIPRPPDDMQAKHWAHLLFGGKICEHCHRPNASKVLFHLRARLCEECLESTLHSIQWPSSFRGIGIQSLLSAEYVEKIAPQPRTQRYARWTNSTSTMYTFADTYERFDAERKTALAQSPEDELKYLRAREGSFIARYEHAEISRKWQLDVLFAQEQERVRRQAEVAAAKKDRKREVEKRLKEKGYNIHDKKIMSGVWKLKGINIAQPLTTEDWNELWPAIRSVVDGNRAQEDTKAASQRHQARLSNVEHHYDRMLRNIDCVQPHEVQYFPRSRDCLLFEPLKSFVEQDAPDPYRQGWDDTTQLEIAIKETLINMRTLQTAHRTSLYKMLIGGGHVDKAVGQEKALSLATSVFRLGRDWSYSLCFGYEVMSMDRKDRQHSYEELHRDSPVKVDDSGISIMRKLQGLLDLNGDATIQDMDAAHGYLVCMSCKPKFTGLELKKGNKSHSSEYVHTREVLSWRMAFKHVYWTHDKTCSNVELRLLTEHEQAALEAKYHDKYKTPHSAPISFGCCHCHEYWKDASKHAQDHRDGLMSKRDIIKHLQTMHALPVKRVKEDVDFWYHPRFERGLLDSSITSFKFIEERA